MEASYNQALDWSKSNKKQLRQTSNFLRKSKSKNLDQAFHSLHEDTFSDIDCLQCANCCKTTSPIFLMTDIERLSKVFKMKVADFIDTYLTLDNDNDYVLKSSPCPFLQKDNSCLVYEERPKACKEYPHTDRKNMRQIINLTYQNSFICPGVSRIMQKIQSIIEHKKE